MYRLEQRQGDENIEALKTTAEHERSMMFAARLNQENAVYQQQTAAAAKPLNQGVKGLAPKTPGNKAPKTPFKVPLNDENAAGKTAGKGQKQDGVFGEGKGTKLDKSAFVTPAGPRLRAPLGNKTTNAKATAFQNAPPPTQEKQSAKQSSPRLRRSKIKVHETEITTAAGESDDDIPDIEYMPPREVPLPDHPDDCWPHDRTYPQFDGQNLTRGWWSVFAGKQGHADNNDDDQLSDFEAKLRVAEEQEQKVYVAQQQPGKNSATPTTHHPLASRSKPPPQTVKAKSAAAALSSKPSRSTPSFAMPTTATKARLPASSTTTVFGGRKNSLPGNPAQTTSTNSRHRAAKVASNTTLGYSKGRAVSSTARKPLFGIYNGEEETRTATHRETPRTAKTSLDALFYNNMGGLNIHKDDEDEEDGSFQGFDNDGGVALNADGEDEADDTDDVFKEFKFEPMTAC